MWLFYGIAWAVGGVAIAVVGVAVSPPRSVPSTPLAVLLGLAGGFVGGLVFELLSRRTVFGFTAGFIGSLITAMVLLIVWTMVVPEPGHRRL